MKILFLKILPKSMGAHYIQQNLVNYNIYRKISVMLEADLGPQDLLLWLQYSNTHTH